MAYSSGIISDFWGKYYQRRAQKGSTLSSSEVASLYEPALDSEYKKSLAAAERERSQLNLDRNYQLEKDRAEKADRAATISGVATIGQGIGSLYLGKKLLDVYGAKKAATPALPEIPGVGKFAAPTAEQAGFGLGTPPASPPTLELSKDLSGAYSLPAEEGLVTGGVASPAPIGAANVGEAALPAAGTGAQASLLPSAYASAPELAAGTGMGEGLAATFGAEAAPVAAAAEPGMLATAGPYAAVAAGSYLGGKLGEKFIPEKWVGSPDARETIGGVATGAAIGTAILPGVGTVIGGIIGAATSFIDDVSVVCSELLRQGRIRKIDRAACVAFRNRFISDEMFAAYLEWAAPHVAAMRKGGWRNYIRLPFAHAFVGYMLSRTRGRKPSFFERVVWNHAWRQCEKIARRNEAGVTEVVLGRVS